jgi:hypothetical protein
MHKSRLAGFIIDCQTDVRSATFWSGALGMELRALPGTEGEKYMRLVDPDDRLHIEVQSVSHPSRCILISNTMWTPRCTAWRYRAPSACKKSTRARKRRPVSASVWSGRKASPLLDAHPWS